MKFFGIQLKLFQSMAFVIGENSGARENSVSDDSPGKGLNDVAVKPRRGPVRRALSAHPRVQKPRVRKGSTSCPRLRHIWLSVRSEYFPHRHDLDEYVVVWSARPQKRTLASCNIKKQRVQVAREMDHEAAIEMLEPLLYHEMCHAVLGMSVVREKQRSQWHGRDFRALERRHPLMPELDKWVKNGGWQSAVRSDRSRRSWDSRRNAR